MFVKLSNVLRKYLALSRSSLRASRFSLRLWIRLIGRDMRKL